MWVLPKYEFDGAAELGEEASSLLLASMVLPVCNGGRSKIRPVIGVVAPEGRGAWCKGSICGGRLYASNEEDEDV